ncbi:DNA repair protein RecN [Chitinimonas lacunae]|uniref:DNA repair protein RecN n=1 Tax=Chitinimonas lacunae TaxID=1963018 RepID=A0ABV8MJ55_9NEIS
MLLTLQIRDFVIVDRLDLAFERGFTVLTGETGAGKSILIDALGLLLGDRADAGMVRGQAERADLSAEFDISSLPELNLLLRDYALDGDEGICLLRRTVDRSGRTRSYVNGRPATAAQLKEIGEFLVDIHGQHAHQSLLRGEAQRALLDAFAGQTELARSVRQAFQAWKKAEEALLSATQDADRFAVERERLAWQIEELGQLNPDPDEWPKLQAEHSRLSHAASLIEGGRAALDTLADGELNAQALLSTVAARMHDLARLDPVLAETVELLVAAEANLDEAVHALRRYSDRVELDPERLAEVEARMDALYRMGRKYRVEPERLAELLNEWRERFAALGAVTDVEALEAAVRTAETAYREPAARLSATRVAAAVELGRAVSTEMQRMAMAGSRFEVALLPGEAPQPFGLEQVEFQVAPHASAPARSIAKVASGGELSRISLALQVVTSRIAQVPTLIFDEVDVGIGGRVAEIVGQLLRQLGERHQVLCITHLPQVAACGNQQFRVAKALIEGEVRSGISVLDQAGRVEEIARMLGGVDITPTTRRHAEEMLGLA